MGLSIGLVGLGQFGVGFVELFQHHPDVSRLALCDVHPDRLSRVAREHGIVECYDSLDALLKTDISSVVLITQPWLHAEQVLSVLGAGKHVYSAVPPAYGFDANHLLDLCDQLVNQVRHSGLVYMLGETTFYRPETVYCRNRAAAGDFGEFVYGECEYWHDIDSPSCSLREVSRLRWGDQWDATKGGDVPMFYPTHAVASMVSIMKAHVTKVSAQGFRYPREDWFGQHTIWGNEFSNEVALDRMSNGASVRHAEFRRVGHPGREGFRLFGTEGAFLDDESGAKWSTRAGWEPVDPATAREPLPEFLAAHLGGHGGSHAYLVHEFVRACIEERTPAISIWDAVRYLAPGLVAHQSASRDGELLAVPDWGDPPGR